MKEQLRYPTRLFITLHCDCDVSRTRCDGWEFIRVMESMETRKKDGSWGWIFGSLWRHCCILFIRVYTNTHIYILFFFSNFCLWKKRKTPPLTCSYHSTIVKHFRVKREKEKKNPSFWGWNFLLVQRYGQLGCVFRGLLYPHRSMTLLVKMLISLHWNEINYTWLIWSMRSMIKFRGQSLWNRWFINRIA